MKLVFPKPRCSTAVQQLRGEVGQEEKPSHNITSLCTNILLSKSKQTIRKAELENRVALSITWCAEFLFLLSFYIKRKTVVHMVAV